MGHLVVQDESGRGGVGDWVRRRGVWVTVTGPGSEVPGVFRGDGGHSGKEQGGGGSSVPLKNVV